LIIVHTALHIINCSTDQPHIACGVRLVRVDPVNAYVGADFITLEGEHFAGNRAAAILFLKELEQALKREAFG
jgi:hypothetical protein